MKKELRHIIGSKPFVYGQSVLLLCYITLNLLADHPFDAYPFILLNLVLSLQAAYFGPLLLIGQNRNEEQDREVLKRIDARFQAWERKAENRKRSKK